MKALFETLDRWHIVIDHRLSPIQTPAGAFATTPDYTFFLFFFGPESYSIIPCTLIQTFRTVTKTFVTIYPGVSPLHPSAPKTLL